MSDTIIYYALMALAGLITGLLAGYNGFQKNRSDAASNLVNNSLALVTSLRAELDRIQAENEKSKNLVTSLRSELASVREENEKLKEAVRRIEMRVRDMEKLNHDLQERAKNINPPVTAEG